LDFSRLFGSEGKAKLKLPNNQKFEKGEKLMKKRILSILLVLTMIVGMFPIWILTANATDDADLSKAQLKNGGNVEITEASVNGKATANNETVKLTTANDSAAVKFAWNGLSREAVVAGYKLVPSIRYYFEGRLAPVDYTPVNNSVTFNTGVAYEGQWMSYILDLVLVKPDGTQIYSGHGQMLLRWREITAGK
jgi:hypothetical protein